MDEIIVNLEEEIIVRVRQGSEVVVKLTEQGPQGQQGPMGDISPALAAARDTAVAAKNDAQSAQTASETARDASQAAKTASETAKGLAETARTGAQTARTGAETARTGAEGARDTANQHRIDAQNAQGQSEAARDASITARNKSQEWAEKATDSPVETGKFSAKHHSDKAASQASAASTQRGLAETARSGAETARTGAETAKTGSDAARDKAEKWADNPVDVAVETGKFSGRHHAQKAADAAGVANTHRDAAAQSFTDVTNAIMILGLPAVHIASSFLRRKADNSGFEYRSPTELRSDIGAHASMSTVSQTEAEAGTATTSRAWTSQRVRQAIASYAATKVHTHEIEEINGLLAQLNLLAAKASPNLTGVPTAPTAANDTNTTQIATTAFVKAVIADMIGGAPGALDTLQELADALGDDPNFAATMTNELAKKLDITAFTGSAILSRLVSVDGHGSSLDADTLDGLHANDFLRSNLTSLVIANPGIGNDSRIEFSKTSDRAGIRVSETANDATTFEFYMADNPDSAADMFQWVIADWKGSGTGTWMPLKFSNLRASMDSMETAFFGGLTLDGRARITLNGNYNDYVVGNGAPKSLTIDVSAHSDTSRRMILGVVKANGDIALYEGSQASYTAELGDGRNAAFNTITPDGTMQDIGRSNIKVRFPTSGLTAGMWWYFTSWPKRPVNMIADVAVTGAMTLNDQAVATVAYTDGAIATALTGSWNETNLPATDVGKSILNAATAAAVRTILGGSANLNTVSQAFAEAGSSTTNYTWTPLRVRQAIVAYAAPIDHVHTVASISGLQVLLDQINLDLASRAPASHAGAGGDAHIDATTNASGFMSATDKSKLNGIAAGAQVNPSAQQIKTAYESNANTNAFSDAEKAAVASIDAKLDASRIWSGTQAQYDALPAKNASTLYFIV